MKLGKRLYRGAIAIDIDGVLADFEGRFCEAFGYDNRQLYSLEARYPEVDPELIKEFVANPDNYRDLAPIFGGVVFTREAYEYSWYVALVTSRPISLRDVTYEWLDRYSQIQYHEVMFSKNKRDAIMGFDAIHPSHPVKMIVDDDVRVLNSMPEKFGVAWAQMWNTGYFARMYHDIEDFGIYITTPNDPKLPWRKLV